MSYLVPQVLVYKILTGEINRKEIFDFALNDVKTCMSLLQHKSTSNEERQKIMVKHTRMADYAELLKKNKLTNKEEEYLLRIAYGNSGNDVICYLENKRKISSEIQTIIVKFLSGLVQLSISLINNNRAFSKLSEENQNKIYEIIAKDIRYASNLLRDKPENPYRQQCVNTVIRTGEGAYHLYENQKRYKTTREEEDKCIAKIATLKSYLKPLLLNHGINLWKEQIDIIVDVVIVKQDFDLLKIVWDMATLTAEQKAKIEPFIVAARLMKAK